MQKKQENKLHLELNEWLNTNKVFNIVHVFNSTNLNEVTSIRYMKSIFYIINRKENASENEISLKESIASQLSNKSHKLNSDEYSGLKYEITPEMLEYKGYNKTKFKNIEGLYGLMQMN